MPNPFSTEATAAVFSPATSFLLLEIIKIEHPDLVTPIRLVNNVEDISALESGGRHTYTACGFRLYWPEDKDNARFTGRIEFDNTDQVLTATLRSLSQYFTIAISMVSQTDLVVTPPRFDNTERALLPMDIKSATITDSLATLHLAFKNIASEKYPRDEFNQVNFPGGNW